MRETDVSVRFLGYGSDEANAINDALKKEEINKVDASPLNESRLLNKILCLSARKGSELNHDLFLLLLVLFKRCITIFR